MKQLHVTLSLLTDSSLVISIFCNVRIWDQLAAIYFGVLSSTYFSVLFIFSESVWCFHRENVGIHVGSLIAHNLAAVLREMELSMPGMFSSFLPLAIKCGMILSS